jgi:hypothetical protein
MRNFWHLTLIMILFVACHKNTAPAIHQVEAPESISIDSLQSVLTWVFNDGKTLWDGMLPVHGNLQLNGDTLVGLNLKLSLQELQVQTKLSTKEKNVLIQGWLDETRLDIDSFPEIRLLVQSDLLTPDESNDELKNSHLIDSIPAKILIENTSYDILLESSMLNTANAQLSIRFKLDAKTWVDSQKKTANSSNKYIDIRIFVVLKP